MSIPAPFDYYTATTVDEAIGMLQRYGDAAKVLAGGHSLIPAMKLRLLEPERLVDIGRIGGLCYIREQEDAVAVGTLTTHAQIERSDLLRMRLGVLPVCAALIGDQQVRNRGTIGGSIAYADPASDMPAVVLALKGEMVVQGPNGQRIIKADDFFTGPFATALEPNEILIEVVFALPTVFTVSAYDKLANKAAHAAVAGCAANIALGGDGTCTAASVAITGAAMQITRARTVEAALVGKRLDQASVAEAAGHAADGLELVGDIHGSKEYRRQMTSVVTRRAILRALEQV
jgi:aerobic carbon-monoxide dehydrogenase medium subunit